MRALTSIVLLFHGLIHLLGLVPPRAETPLTQSSDPVLATASGTNGIAGVTWALAAAILVTASALRATSREIWWVIAAIGLVLSQVLIVSDWSRAWAGTLVNVILAVGVIVAGASSRFHATSRSIAHDLLARPSVSEPSIVQAEELGELPPPVRRWLAASGVVGRPRARSVRLKQRGGLRTAATQPFMPAAAIQYFTVNPPGFVWTVDVTMFRIVPVVGRDLYADGSGRMLITAGGLFRLADGTGPGFDQGTALRFLGEIVWFPSAALAPYITWAAVDDRHADATLTFKNVQATARFEFDELGRFLQLSAQRSFNGQGLEAWTIPADGWDTIRGITMPVRGTAIWRLAAGDLEYYRWEILDVEENPPGLWDGED